MAVDYLHRLVISGRRNAVRDLVRSLHREYPRTVAGETSTEIVQFSFEALYAIAPQAARIEPQFPYDPYEVSVWPIRTLLRGKAQARYQFQTRNLAMADFIRLLARKRPNLTFLLVTLCVDSAAGVAAGIGERTSSGTGDGRRSAAPSCSRGLIASSSGVCLPASRSERGQPRGG